MVSSADAADLDRLGLLAAGDIFPGCTQDLVILADHTRWPVPPGPPDPARALEALSFGVQLPSPLEYVSHTFDGTYLKTQLGHDPDFASVRPVTGGVTVGLVMDLEMQEKLPEGINQSILKIKVRVPSSTPVGTVLAPTLVGTLGNPTVPLEMLLRLGSVTPVTKNGKLKVVAGTCWVPGACFTPAAVVLLPAEPEVSEETESEELPEAIDWADPSTIPFEEPAPGELTEEPAAAPVESQKPEPATEASAIPQGGGGLAPEAILALGAAAASATAGCDCSARVTQVPPTREVCSEPAGGVEIAAGANAYALEVAAGDSVDIVSLKVKVDTTFEAGLTQDLSISLTSPAGTVVSLLGSGTAPATSMFVYFADDGIDPVGTPPDFLCGCRIDATDDLAAALGTQPSAGTWTLTITNGAAGDTAGTLNEWCILASAEAQQFAHIFVGNESCDAPGSLLVDGPNTFELDVAENVTIVDLKVHTQATHPYLPELDLSIESPSGTTVDLYDGLVLVGTELDVFWSDNGFPQGTPPANCSCRVLPVAGQSLGAFKGESSAGVWVLTVTEEDLGLGTGTLAEWCVLVNTPDVTRTVLPPGPAPPDDPYNPTYVAIGAAIAAASASTVDHEVIQVLGATFDESLIIDAGDFRGRSLWIYATASPDREAVDPPAATVNGGAATDIRCLEITGNGADECRITIGALRTESPSGATPTIDGWRGFLFRDGGTDFFARGAGVLIGTVPYPTAIELESQVNFVGNVVLENGVEPQTVAGIGGGVAVVSCRDVFLFQNDVEGNKAQSRAAGIDLAHSAATLVSNWIHDNVYFVSLDPTTSKVGGGVFFRGGNAVLCQNRIYSNEAWQGCGVYARLDESGFGFSNEPKLHFEANEVLLNHTWNPPGLGGPPLDPGEDNPNCPATNPGYLGGGLFVGAEPEVAGTATCVIVGNMIHLNDITATPGNDPCRDEDDAPSQAGGGAYLDLVLTAAGAGDPLRPRYMINNFVNQNTARNRAGGVWLGVFAEAAERFPFYHNTVVDNELVGDPVIAEGTEVYLPFVGGYPQVNGQNNTAYNGSDPDPATYSDWYAECDPDAAASPPPAWGFTQLRDEGGTACDTAGQEEHDIAGTGAEDLDDLGFIPLAKDIDLDDRPFPAPYSIAGVALGSVPDRGADEFAEFEPPRFKRGDCNGDGTVAALIDAL